MDFGDDDEDSGGPGLDLTGFLFGNINEKGELEDSDVLDSELILLGSFGPFGKMVRDIDSTVRDEGASSDENEHETGISNVISRATDFSCIDEGADDLYESSSQKRTQPEAVSFRSRKDDSDDDYDEPMDEDGTAKQVAKASPSSWSGGSKEDLYAHVMEHFPEFAPNKVLRFSRLFASAKSLSRPQIWANAERHNKSMGTDAAVPPCWRYDEDGNKEFYLPSPGTPPPEMVDSGDEAKFLQSSHEWKKSRDGSQANFGLSREISSKEDKPGLKENKWRHGAAKLVYDLAGVPEDATELDYGINLKPSAEEEAKPLPQTEVPDEAFLMVNQVCWEDDIIWSPEIKESILNSAVYHLATVQGPANRVVVRTFSGGLNSPGVGGKSSTVSLPSPLAKFPGSTVTIVRSSALPPTTPTIPSSSFNPTSQSSETPEKYSIFPIENEELIYGNWEDEVIIDPDNMTKIPSRTVMKLDPNDSNLLLGIPYDPEPEDNSSQQMPTKKFTSKERRSRILLGKAGIIKMEQNEVSETVEKHKDPFNVSCDDYYMPKQDTSSMGLKIGLEKNVIQHSIPAMELFRDWFPTHLTAYQMRHFHRLPLKAHKKVADIYIPVRSLAAHVADMASAREKERAASGGGDVFFMRRPGDLSAMDGDFVLTEYCEEHPPHVMATGMATKLVNYYKRKPLNDSGAPKAAFGETSYVQKSPFLGQITPGKLLSSMENNLFRAPMYRHRVPETDFLVVMHGDSFWIRDITALFSVGQQCPKFEIPGPKSKKTSNHVKEFLQCFIYRLFLASEDEPKRIRMEDIRKAFPHLSESSIRKRLKGCADFNRTGSDSGWWRLKDNFRLPSEEELRAMVSPEQCCAFYSMLAAKQRLVDAGYGGKSLFTPDDDMEEDSQKIDDEVRTAPWNTTRHFIAAAQGKCLLDVNGSADPTGCGEGFSYIRIPNKPIAGKVKEEATEKKKQKTVTGTDADLRKLLLKDARDVLRRFNVPEEEIQKLSRWEVVDVVRAMSTQAAKQGEGETSRFARGNRFSIAEHQERYKDECQRIFDLQNTVLSSDVVLSTDEGSSSEEDDEYDKLGMDLESLISSKKTKNQYTHEQEEAERRELKKLVDEGTGLKTQETPKKDDDDNSVASFGSSVSGSRRLVIYRTFREDGREFVRREVVKKPSVIDAYVKIASNKDRNLKAQFASQDDQHREEMKKEKRRIQEQLRRLKRSKEREKVKPQKPKKEKVKPELQLKCGACGQKGHMKTNKNCPMYNKGSVAAATVAAATTTSASAAASTASAASTSAATADVPPPRVPTTPITPAMTEEQQAAEESILSKNDVHIRVEGTKIALNKAFVNQAENLWRKSLLLKFPRDAVRKRKRGSDMHCDYLQGRRKSAQRRKTSSELVLNGIFEGILVKMKLVPESHPFHLPVSSKIVPDYYDIIKSPMDLQTIRENIRKKAYNNRNQFMEHVSLILTNCQIYNGQQDGLSKTAQQMVDACRKELLEKEEMINELEKEINPLLGDDPQMAFSFLLERVIDRMKAVPDSAAFHQSVNGKKVLDYYEIVKDAMDLETLRLNVQEFRTREEFIEQAQLIETNCVLYNGESSLLTPIARKILSVCREALAAMDEQLTSLEEEIAMLPEETDSLAGESRSRLDSVERDDSSFPSSKGGTPMVPHSLSISDDPSMAGDFRSSLLMQDLEASDDDDDDDDENIPVGLSPGQQLFAAGQCLSQGNLMEDDDDDDKDIDFEPDIID